MKIFLSKHWLSICIITTILCFNSVSAGNLDKLDVKGNEILIIIRRLAYWIILIIASKEVIKNMTNHDLKGIGNTILKYVIVYGSLWFIPWILKSVEGLF